MPLKFVVDSLEGVDQAHQALYAKNDQGKFVLDVEGAVPAARLNEFRDNNIELKRQLEAFKGIEPAKYKEALEKLSKIDQKALLDAGQVDQVVNERVASMKQEYETQIGTLSKQATEAQQRLAGLLIDSAVKSAALAAGVAQTAVDDVVLRAKTFFQVQDGEVVALNDKGHVIYGKDGEKPMTIGEWVTNLKAQAPHLFAKMNGGGAGGSGQGGGVDFSKLTPTQKIAMGLNQKQ